MVNILIKIYISFPHLLFALVCFVDQTFKFPLTRVRFNRRTSRRRQGRHLGEFQSTCVNCLPNSDNYKPSLRVRASCWTFLHRKREKPKNEASVTLLLLIISCFPVSPNLVLIRLKAILSKK